MRNFRLGPLFLAATLLFAVEARANVLLSAPAVAAPPGAVVAVPIAFTGVADAPTIVVSEFSYDAERLTPLGGLLTGPNPSNAMSFDWNVANGTLIAIVYSLDSAFTTQNGFTLYFGIADDAPNGTYSVTRTGGSATNAAIAMLATTLAPLNITVNANLGTHSADTNGDWSVSLGEVLRIIQFYNTGALHCEGGTEDGFSPGPGDQSCIAHDSDYAPFDWKIGLAEVLRVIQFYNFIGGSYHPDANGEDGYAAGPF